MIFVRRAGPMISLVVRAFCLLVAFGAYASSQKTVRWTEALSLDSWNKRILHIVAPPIYRHSSNAFGFLYFCFNSDFFVVLYALSVAADEDVSMVYGRVMGKWANLAADTDIWNHLRLRAMSFRWLWLNLLLIKTLKWICHLVSSTKHTGSNKLMGWLNFSSIPSIYMTLIALFMRNDYIEYGNSVRMDLTSAVQDLDTIYVEFADSWYIRGLLSLLVLMLANLFLVLFLDHLINRRWWRLMSKNTLARQHIYNSTSILTNMGLIAEEFETYSTITIKARTLCTFQWFLTSHLKCFGLPESPGVMRQITSAKIKTKNSGIASSDATSLLQVPKDNDAKRESISSSQPTPTDILVVVQDNDGYLHLFDSDKREVQSLGIEVKILRDSSYKIA